MEKEQDRLKNVYSNSAIDDEKSKNSTLTPFQIAPELVKFMDINGVITIKDSILDDSGKLSFEEIMRQFESQNSDSSPKENVKKSYQESQPKGRLLETLKRSDVPIKTSSKKEKVKKEKVITNEPKIQNIEQNDAKIDKKPSSKKVKGDEKHMHDGHRARLFKSYSQLDLETLSPHQVMEYILFFIFPRGDVNPLAHRLIDHFGTVQAVLDADESELKNVYGINERAAIMLASFVRFFDYYTNCKIGKQYHVESMSDLFDYCEELLRFKNREQLFIIGLDTSGNIIGKRRLCEGNSAKVGTSSREVASFITSTEATQVAFCHNHPGGFAVPSKQDYNSNEYLKDLVSVLQTKFVDHIIIARDGIYSMAADKKVVNFEEL